MTQNHGVPLSQLHPGDRCEVLQVQAHGAIRQRLLETGFIRGAPLRVEKLAPLGDPIVLAITG